MIHSSLVCPHKVATLQKQIKVKYWDLNLMLAQAKSIILRGIRTIEFHRRDGFVKNLKPGIL